MADGSSQSGSPAWWLGVVGVIAAPTTLVTGLAFYFGYVATRTRLGYFGIDANALGFTGSDYVLESVGVLYLPVLAALLAWVAVVWVGRRAHGFIGGGRRPRLARSVAVGTGAVGCLLVGSAVLAVANTDWAIVDADAAAPVSLAAGLALLGVGYWVTRVDREGPESRRPVPPTERLTLVIGVLMSVLAAFWLTNVFAAAYGEDRAAEQQSELWGRQSAVEVDTPNRLFPPANIPYVYETTLTREGAAQPVYRYMCLRSLLVRGDRWVLVPARWQPEHGYAIIVTTDETTHVNLRRYKGLTDEPAVGGTTAGDWKGDWLCPEVAPMP